MQRYGGKWLIPSFFFNFSWEACDTCPLLRQRRERGAEFVAKEGEKGNSKPLKRTFLGEKFGFMEIIPYLCSIVDDE